MSKARFLDTITNLCEYRSLRFIRVRSPLLGTLHYGFSLAIFLYIACYVFGVQKRYLFIETPDGLQRVVVQDPCVPVRAQDACTYPDEKQGTRAVGQHCYPPKAFRCTRHSYCLDPGTEQKHIHTEPGGRLLCRYWDHNSIVWPAAENGAVTVASRASLIEQQLVNMQMMEDHWEEDKGNHSDSHKEGRKPITPEMLCKNQTEMMCQWYPPAIAHSLYSEKDAYVADLENFTVRLHVLCLRAAASGD